MFFKKIIKYFKNYISVDEFKLNSVDDIYVASVSRISILLSLFIGLASIILMIKLLITSSSMFFQDTIATCYLFSYLTLFLISTVTHFVLKRLLNNFEKNRFKLRVVIYTFSCAILAWAYMTTILELINNSNFAVVFFLTAIMGIFTGVLGKSKVVIPTLIVLFVTSNIFFPYASSKNWSFNASYFVGSLIFMSITGLVSIFNLNAKRREWKYRLESKMLNETLASLAQTDTLTQLKNRMTFEDDLTREANDCNQNGYNLLCLEIDIDEFKKINDSYGHHAGDLVLVEVAKVIKSYGKLAYRFGGDEFFIVNPCMTYDSAISLVKDIQVGVKNIRLKEIDYKEVTISIGGYYGDASKNQNTILKQIDDAVCYVKQRGRNDYYLINS